MRYIELENIEPEVGDIVGLELGGTLIETVITEIRDDGVVISLDENAVNVMLEATQVRRLAESRLAEVIPSYRSGNDDFTSYNYGRYLSKDDLIDKDDDRETPKPQEPKSVSSPKPDAKPSKSIDSAGCENAISWGRKTLRDLDRTLRRELSSHGEQAVIEYLKIVAREDNAYSKFKFSKDDLVDCQQLLNTVTGNSNIKNWNDVLKNLSHDDIKEAEYQGRKVALGKPMAGDVKKSKVYVKGPKGNVVKVNFGDPNMKIKKSNPARRKSFRARHNCDNPGPRWKARYWSCRAW
jgi:hypothetical protein